MKDRIEFHQSIIKLLHTSRNKIFSTLGNNRNIKIFQKNSHWFFIEKNFNHFDSVHNAMLEKKTNIGVFDFKKRIFSDIKSKIKQILKNNTKNFQNLISSIFSTNELVLIDIFFQLKTYNLFFVLVVLLLENIFGNFISFIDLLNGICKSFSFIGFNFLNLNLVWVKIYLKIRNKLINFINSFRSFFLFFFFISTRRQ